MSIDEDTKKKLHKLSKKDLFNIIYLQQEEIRLLNEDIKSFQAEIQRYQSDIRKLKDELSKPVVLTRSSSHDRVKEELRKIPAYEALRLAIESGAFKEWCKVSSLEEAEITD